MLIMQLHEIENLLNMVLRYSFRAAMTFFTLLVMKRTNLRHQSVTPLPRWYNLSWPMGYIRNTLEMCGVTKFRSFTPIILSYPCLKTAFIPSIYLK